MSSISVSLLTTTKIPKTLNIEPHIQAKSHSMFNPLNYCTNCHSQQVHPPAPAKHKEINSVAAVYSYLPGDGLYDLCQKHLGRSRLLLHNYKPTLPSSLLQLNSWAGQLHPWHRPTPHTDTTSEATVRHKKTTSEKNDDRREDAAGREALQHHDGTDALKRPQNESRPLQPVRQSYH